MKINISKFQKKMGLTAIKYFAFLAVCGLISRGIYSANLPQVSTGYGSNMRLSHKVEREGKIVENRTLAVSAEPNLLISSFLVESGQQVTEGTPLLQIDMDDLNEKIESAKIQIKKKEIEISTINKNKTLSNQEQELMKKRAEEDYASTKHASDVNSSKAQENLNQAKQGLDSLGNKKSYINKKKEKDDQYKSLNKAIAKLEKELEKLNKTPEKVDEIEAKKAEVKAAKAELKEYTKTLEKTLLDEWESQKAQYESDISGGEDALRGAQQEGQTNLTNANRAKEDANAALPGDSSLELAQLDLGELKKQLDIYEALNKEKGIIKSTCEGDIIKINASAGDITGESAILTMTDKTAGYRFVAKITKDEKKYVELNDIANVEFGDNKNLEVILDAIEEDAEDSEMYSVSGEIKEGVSLGDIGTLRVEKSSDENRFCIPLEAIRGSGADMYVLVLETTNTILGDQLKAVKYQILILDKNNEDAVIQGSVSDDMPIIISSTRAIREGDTVRLLEN